MYTLMGKATTGSRRGRGGGGGGEEYLPICKACVNDGKQLVWSRGKKTNKFQDATDKRKGEGDKGSNVRGKKAKNAGGT